MDGLSLIPPPVSGRLISCSIFIWSLRVCHWFQAGFFFSRFSDGHISRLCCYISLHSTHLLGRSVLEIKRSHTKIKSDLLTPTHCMVSCELVLVDMVTVESNLRVGAGAAKAADCCWSDGCRRTCCFPG